VRKRLAPHGKHNIKFVVNCTGNSVPSHPDLGRRGGTSFIQFMVAETTTAPDVYDCFAYVCDSVVAALAAGKSVLVHCRAGAHRAGTVAVALVMHMSNMSARDAVKSVKRCRPVVSISGSFWDVLKHLDAAERARAQTGTTPEAAGRPSASASSASASASALASASASAPVYSPPEWTPMLVAAPAADPAEPEPVAAPAAEERPTTLIPVDIETSSEEDVIGTVRAPVAAPAAVEPAERPLPRFQTGWLTNPGG